MRFVLIPRVGHRANILNPNLTSIGVGLVQGSDGRWYWTQNFGGY